MRRRLVDVGKRLHWSGGEELGLVLSGGGGKGAYEIGCLEALRDAGIKDFSTIVGTSVGSLNAALVAQGELDTARRIWKTISRSKVLIFTNPVQRAVRRFALLPFYVFRESQVARKRVPPSLWEAVTVFYRTWQHPMAVRRRLIEDFKPLFKKAFESLAQLLGYSLVIAAGLWIAPIGGSEYGVFQDLSDLLRLGWGVFVIALSLSVVGALLWIWFVIQDQHLATTASLASNAPLRRLLNESLDVEKLRVGPPTYVTVASLRVVDLPAAIEAPTRTSAAPASPPGESTAPDPPQGRLRRWWSENLATKSDFSQPTAAPEPTDPEATPQPAPEAVWASGRVAYVPSYLVLQEMPAAEVRERILDSASLPEVFPRRALDDGDVVDGGVADNTPLLPLLRVGIRNVVVVYLDRKQGLSDSPARIRRLDRDSRSARSFGAEPLPHSPPLPETHVSLLRVIPSVSLGSLVSGTLNFSARRAGELIRLGYADTLEALENGPEEWVV